MPVYGLGGGGNSTATSRVIRDEEIICDICGDVGNPVHSFFERGLALDACDRCELYIAICQMCSLPRLLQAFNGEVCMYCMPLELQCATCSHFFLSNEAIIVNKRNLRDDELALFNCASCQNSIRYFTHPPTDDVSFFGDAITAQNFIAGRAPTARDLRPANIPREVMINNNRYIAGSGNYRKCYICSRDLTKIYQCTNCMHYICSVCVNRHNETGNFALKKCKIDGKIITKPYFIGVELEAERGNVVKLSKLLDKDIMFSHDGSLHNKGIEINFPPLQKKDLEKKVNDASRALIHSGFIGTSSCGLHIHIGGEHILKDSKKQAQLIKTIYAIEDIIFSVLPPSRWNNRYCKRLSDYYLYKNFKIDLDQKGLENIWYDTSSEEDKEARKEQKYDDTRYAGFNLHSLFFRGTIEFRYHSGTVQAHKILYWASLLSHIYDWAINNYDEKMVKALFDAKTSFTKFQLLFQLLKIDKPTFNYFLNRAYRFNPDFTIKFNKGKEVRESEERIEELSEKDLMIKAEEVGKEIKELVKEIKDYKLPDKPKVYEDIKLFNQFLSYDPSLWSKDQMLPDIEINDFSRIDVDLGVNKLLRSIVPQYVHDVMGHHLIPSVLVNKYYSLTEKLSNIIFVLNEEQNKQKGFTKHDELSTILNYIKQQKKTTNDSDVESVEEAIL